MLCKMPYRRHCTDGRTADERARTGGRADERTDGRVHCGRGAGRGCGLSGVIPLLRHPGPANGEMVLLNVLPRDETDGRTADERADGRTGGRADGRTGALRSRHGAGDADCAA